MSIEDETNRRAADRRQNADQPHDPERRGGDRREGNEKPVEPPYTLIADADLVRSYRTVKDASGYEEASALLLTEIERRGLGI